MNKGRQDRPKGQLRQRQLITTFGPGAMLDMPKCSVIIGGLEHWTRDKSAEIREPRLAAKVAQLLNVPHLKLYPPPPHDDRDQHGHVGAKAFIFPKWFLVENESSLIAGKREAGARRLVHERSLENGKYKAEGGEPLTATPVRFVCACPAGHISDINWCRFVHGGKTDCRQPLWLYEHGASNDLSAIEIVCECGKRRSMVEATTRGSLGQCNGDRPWLGQEKYEQCPKQSRLLIRSASNTYLSRTFSVISLLTEIEELAAAVDQVWANALEGVQTEEHLQYELTKPRAKTVLAGYTAEKVMAEIRRRRAAAEGTAHSSVKEDEFNILTQSREGDFTDLPRDNFIARSLPRRLWDEPLMEPVERVVLVHRLKEVVALIGFTRFEAMGVDIDGELQIGVAPAALAEKLEWIPAVENPGEGVFLQFRQEAVNSWLTKEAVRSREEKLKKGLDLWKAEREISGRVFPGMAYIMLHSLAHMLITEISLECGYSSSAIRERIYGSERTGYGILLYTGSSDSEGTLGGLVEAGRRMPRHLCNALEAGKLCSNDPVCAQHSPDNKVAHRYLHGAACHGCLLISETSCEHFNDFLDRSLVVPTVEGLSAEFFSM